MASDKVQVLLSSYNGENYIREQLDSILSQQTAVELLIRDDGSTDSTPDILREYAEKHSNIQVLYGENVGVIQSFFALLQAADSTSPYIALADQDDVWLPEKLARAQEMLAKQEQQSGASLPLVYCSAKKLVDEKLQPLPNGIHYPEVHPEFGNALVENMCTGCTCVFNGDLLRLLQGKVPEFTIMHDFWIYLVGTCFGKAIYDEESYVLYRQHGNNELGEASSLFENYKKRIRNFKKHRWQLSRQAESLLKCYGDSMPEENKSLVQRFIAARKHLGAGKDLIKEKAIFRQRKSDQKIMELLLWLGLL